MIRLRQIVNDTNQKSFSNFLFFLKMEIHNDYLIIFFVQNWGHYRFRKIACRINMKNAQPHRFGDQLASHAVILRLLHFLADVTELAIRKSFGLAKAVQPCNC